MQQPKQMSTPEQWRGTFLAGLANYNDAGSIVSGSVAMRQDRLAEDVPMPRTP